MAIAAGAHGRDRPGLRRPRAAAAPHQRPGHEGRGRPPLGRGQHGRRRRADRHRRLMPGRRGRADLHEALLARGETVAAAESLTAGLFCASLAEVPGASATLRGGVVVYATDLKSALAGVPADLLAAHGPVSRPTAARPGRGRARAVHGDVGRRPHRRRRARPRSTATGPVASTSASPTGGGPTSSSWTCRGTAPAVRERGRRRRRGRPARPARPSRTAGTPAR